MSTTSSFKIQKPRVYRGFSTDEQFRECLHRVLEAGGSSKDGLSEKLFDKRGLTVEEYLRRHLPYTVYLLDVAMSYAPLPGDVLTVLKDAARDMLDDAALRRNHGRLFKSDDGKDEHGKISPAPAIVRPMEMLDRGTWFVEPGAVGAHVPFGGAAAEVPYSPPAMGLGSAAEFFVDGDLHYVPFMRVERTPAADKHQPGRGQDVVKVSTEENPLWGQTYIRHFVEKREYMIPGGKCFRRLEVLRLLAKNAHFSDGRRHFQAPAYTYIDQGNGYLLLHPPLQADAYLSEGVCMLSEFANCRPRWWTVLGKEEKVSSVFSWMTCLASTVSLFHSLKVSHGRINSNNVVLVHNAKSGKTTVFITDWHMSPPGQTMKSSIGSSSRIASSGPTIQLEGDAPMAERYRQQDVKDLGEVFGDLLLLVLGTSRPALTRQRKERINWANDIKSRDGFLKNLVENEDDQNRGFYPPPPAPISPVTIVNNTAGLKADTPVSGASTPEAKTDISERRQSKAILKEPAGKLFSSVFSKRSSTVPDGATAISTSTAASNAAAQAASELQDRAKFVQQQLNTMLPFSIGKSGPQFAVSWWVEELRLMYPPVIITKMVTSPKTTTAATADTKTTATPATEDSKDAKEATDAKDDKEAPKEGEAGAEAPKKEDETKTHHRSRSSQDTERQTLKNAELLGNKLLPLLATMVSSEPSLRPKSREVWTNLSSISEGYIDGSKEDGSSCCCRCSHSKGSEEEVIWDEIAETVLRDLYERGVADDEEEAWEGLGAAAAAHAGGKFGWRRIGRVGEGVAAECLLD